LRFDHDEMTQEELACKAGCTRQTIIALEARKYTPSLVLAFRIARAFNRRVEDVFKYEVPIEDQASPPWHGEHGSSIRRHSLLASHPGRPVGEPFDPKEKNE